MSNLKDKIKESQNESGFSIKGFSRREFGMMAIICQTVLEDDSLLEEVNPLGKFEGLDHELSTLLEKLNDFLDVEK